MSLNQKSVPLTDALIIVKQWKNEGCKLVFTNGCFDLLHPGHIDYLSKAKRLGDKLIIGLNSDNSVKQLKGTTRPINNEYFRTTMLSALEFVDLIIIFSDETPIKLITEIEPNILVKGGDYKFENIVGAKEIVKNGGEVKIIPFLNGFSSTNLIKNIQNLTIKE